MKKETEKKMARRKMVEKYVSIVKRVRLDRILSAAELIENVRNHIKENKVEDGVISILAASLAIALAEDVNFIRENLKS